METKEALVDFSSHQADELVSELRYALQGDCTITRPQALALYELLFDTYQEVGGGCDHSVGICLCSLQGALQNLAVTLGYQLTEKAEYVFDFPHPDQLKEKP